MRHFINKSLWLKCFTEIIPKYFFYSRYLVKRKESLHQHFVDSEIEKKTTSNSVVAGWFLNIIFSFFIPTLHNENDSDLNKQNIIPWKYGKTNNRSHSDSIDLNFESKILCFFPIFQFVIHHCGVYCVQVYYALRLLKEKALCYYLFIHRFRF